jgi:hypothetical protein
MVDDVVLVFSFFAKDFVLFVWLNEPRIKSGYWGLEMCETRVWGGFRGMGVLGG